MSNISRMEIEQKRWNDNGKQSFKKTYLICLDFCENKNQVQTDNIKSEIYNFFNYDTENSKKLSSLRDIPKESVLVRTDYDDVSIIRHKITYEIAKEKIKSLLIFDVNSIYDYTNP